MFSFQFDRISNIKKKKINNYVSLIWNCYVVMHCSTMLSISDRETVCSGLPAPPAGLEVFWGFSLGVWRVRRTEWESLSFMHSFELLCNDVTSVVKHAERRWVGSDPSGQQHPERCRRVGSAVPFVSEGNDRKHQHANLKPNNPTPQPVRLGRLVLVQSEPYVWFLS